jgi:dTDP-glucose 4,6-dehydratase
MNKIIVTGAAGFIGHHIVEHFLKNTDAKIYVFDKLTYSSNGLDRLRDINVFDENRVQIFTIDLTQPIPIGVYQEVKDATHILHLAAESHVDNSITDPIPFVMSNVLGTAQILNFTRQLDNLELMVYFSTDEVFGPAPDGYSYKEWDRYKSSNPYAAAKAGGEELCIAFENTYKVPVIITHCMNVVGERQHPEKFVPLVIRKALHGEMVTIHSHPDKTRAGSRFYIHARNVADAVHFLMDYNLNNPNHQLTMGDKFNIVGEKELDNRELALMLADFVGKPLIYEMSDFHSARPGHDLRYALNGSKMAQMGWTPKVSIEESLKKIVEWTLKPENSKWLYI